MLKPADVQEFNTNNNTDHYFNLSMETLQDSPPHLKPQQGKFIINNKTVSLYLYNNPWVYLKASQSQVPAAAINTIFHYCVVCRTDNYESEDFKNLANIDVDIDQWNYLTCDKVHCQQEILELLNDKYRGFVKALLDKNSTELKKYADA